VSYSFIEFLDPEKICEEWCYLPPFFIYLKSNYLKIPSKPSKNLATNKKPLTILFVSG
jgi:hypothetical protein